MAMLFSLSLSLSRVLFTVPGFSLSLSRLPFLSDFLVFFSALLLLPHEFL